MFTEKNLPRLIIATPIFTIFVFALLIIYFFVSSQYSNFQEESKELEQEYIFRQKNILKNENEKIQDYIKHHRKLGTSRKEIIKWIQHIRYEQNGYVWVHDTSHHLVAHPFRQDSIGMDDTNNTDETGAKIFQQFVKIAISNKNGGFVEYFWSKPDSKELGKKIGFLKLDKKWGWVVGTGLYVDDIESSIAIRKARLEEKIDKYIRIILWSAFSLMGILGAISFLISQNIVRVFTEYREKVSKKEQALKELNKMLTSRVKEAVKESKKRDKTLLQQSKLAQMGEMISMIAHQWRQPLSEISGIFMELETASKFSKADSELIKKESIEGNHLISYMSKTIDDFRDFFKPAKTKEVFSVKRACEEAITLSNASLNNSNIELNLHVKNDLHVKGYSSEFAQVVLNLILNAKDTLVERKIQNPKIAVEINKDIKVRDNAKGIESDIIDKVFEPYFSTKKRSGTGLGLYMAKMIIEENMGGKLFVFNDDEGAVFCIKI